jgi:hypothetical protein
MLAEVRASAEAATTDRVQKAITVWWYQWSAKAVVGKKRADHRSKGYGWRSHGTTEGLHVKIRGQITRFYRTGEKQKHVRELLARG